MLKGSTWRRSRLEYLAIAFAALLPIPSMPGILQSERAASSLGQPACAAPTLGPQMLRDPGFEDPHAGAWGYNRWGAVSVASAPVTAQQHSGATSLGSTVSDLADGGVLLKQNVVMASGRSYAASAWLRSPDKAVVQLKLRREAADYESAAVETIQLTPVWQQYSIVGGFDSNVSAY